MKKLVSTLTAILGISTLAAQDVVVKGPDEKLQLAVFVQNETKPCYSVSYNGKTMLEKSPLGMNTNIGDFTKNLKLTGHSVDKIDTVYQQTRIKVSNVHYRANELTCHLENEQGQKLGVIFRVSDNDVAFRYTLPHQGGSECDGEGRTNRFPLSGADYYFLVSAERCDDWLETYETQL